MPKRSETAADIEIDKKLQSRCFSPSALNVYLHCPREFYYHYVANIQTPDDRKGIIDARDFGTMVHYVAEQFYAKHPHGVSEQELETLFNDSSENGINYFIKEAFEKEKVTSLDFTEELVRKNVIDLLKYDASEKPLLNEFDFLRGEFNANTIFDVKNPKTCELERVTIYGSVDRMDMAYFKDDSGFNSARTLRVIDYKTGGHVLEAKDIDALFNNRLVEDGKEIYEDNPKYLFQAFVYSLLMLKNPHGARSEKDQPDIESVIKGAPIVPALYYISHMSEDEFVPYLTVGGNLITDFKAQVSDEFEEKLKLLLEQIIDPNNDFPCAESDKACSYCNFKQLCAKGRKTL